MTEENALFVPTESPRVVRADGDGVLSTSGAPTTSRGSPPYRSF